MLQSHEIPKNIIPKIINRIFIQPQQTGYHVGGDFKYERHFHPENLGKR